MLDQGYATLFSLSGVRWRAHWSIALGIFYFSGFRFEPGAWLGYLVLVIGHELGHALLVRGYGLRVFSIDVHGFGGACVHQRARSELQESVIAWGGVLAQLCLFIAARLWSRGRMAESVFEAHLLHVLNEPNLTIAAINLLPFPGLDGSKAWRLFGLLKRRTTVAPKRPSERPRATKPSSPRASDAPLKLVRDEEGDFRFEVDDEKRPKR